VTPNAAAEPAREVHDKEVTRVWELFLARRVSADGSAMRCRDVQPVLVRPWRGGMSTTRERQREMPKAYRQSSTLWAVRQTGERSRSRACLPAYSGLRAKHPTCARRQRDRSARAHLRAPGAPDAAFAVEAQPVRIAKVRLPLRERIDEDVAVRELAGVLVVVIRMDVVDQRVREVPASTSGPADIGHVVPPYIVFPSGLQPRPFESCDT
jgi:hypothetical protein